MNCGTCDFIITDHSEFVKGKMKLIVLFTNCFKIKRPIYIFVSNDFGHIVEGIVSVGDVSELGVGSVLACYLGGSAGSIVLVSSLVLPSLSVTSSLREVSPSTV